MTYASIKFFPWLCPWAQLICSNSEKHCICTHLLQRILQTKKVNNHAGKMDRDRCGERGIDLLCPFNLETQLSFWGGFFFLFCLCLHFYLWCWGLSTGPHTCRQELRLGYIPNTVFPPEMETLFYRYNWLDHWPLVVNSTINLTLSSPHSGNKDKGYKPQIA